MNINWQDIKDKYSKAFSLFREYTIRLGFVEIERDSLFICYPFLLFGVFERFFDSVGIIIEVFINPFKNGIEWCYSVHIPINKKIYTEKKIETREESQDMATIRAFEILNIMIKKGEIK